MNSITERLEKSGKCLAANITAVITATHIHYAHSSIRIIFVTMYPYFMQNPSLLLMLTNEIQRKLGINQI